MIRTLSELFYAAIPHDLPDALAHRVAGEYRGISHQELLARVERMVLALQGRGLVQGDRLALLCENKPEWAILDYACALSGIVTVPIHPSVNAEQVGYILRHSGSRWVFVQNQDQLDKVLAIWKDMPELETVLILEGAAPRSGNRPMVRWRDLVAEGEGQEGRRAEVRSLAEARQPEDLLTIIYTSGTTGDPKGSMLSHGNLVSNILAALAAIPLTKGETCLSLLPLSHIFERMAGHFTMLYAGVRIYYAEHVSAVGENMLEVRPHVLLGVPRIYEKIYARIQDAAITGGLVKRLVFRWARTVGFRLAPVLYRGGKPGVYMKAVYNLADRLVFRSIRERTGGRLKLTISGGVALEPELMEFFWAVGIPIYEGYGLTETSPILAVNRPGEVEPGTVGRPLYGSCAGRPYLKISPEGEILCQGPNVMSGYWRDEEATREAFDQEGYFHTGDAGSFDDEGRLRVVDRMKEIILTSEGKAVAPQPIENRLRSDRYIEQALLVGDGRSFITALIVPTFVVLRRWADRRKLAYSTDAELVALPQVKALMDQRVQAICRRFVPDEQVRRIHLLDKELTAEAGFLTPSMKVKRRIVLQAFAEAIDRMYA